MSHAHATLSWIPTDDEFGARLALVRQRMGWNIKEAALACNLPAASWREWEISARKPRDLAEVAGAIAARTGADDYWLMTGKNNGEHPSGPGDGLADGDEVRHQGLEPRTRWLRVVADDAMPSAA